MFKAKRGKTITKAEATNVIKKSERRLHNDVRTSFNKMTRELREFLGQ